MRASITSAAIAALLMLPACGPGANGPTGELAAVLNFAAYPGGTLVGEGYSGGGGPLPMPVTDGWREYRTDDPPAKIRAHYEQLAKTHGWGFTAPMGLTADDLGVSYSQVGTLVHKRRTLNVNVANAPGVRGAYGPYDRPHMPSPSPSAGASPAPRPTVPPGPWYVRTDAFVSAN